MTVTSPPMLSVAVGSVQVATPDDKPRDIVSTTDSGQLVIIGGEESTALTGKYVLIKNTVCFFGLTTNS